MEPSDAPHAPTIEDVKHIIEEARDAEHTLEKVMPNAIHAHDDEFVGMTGDSGPAKHAHSEPHADDAQPPAEPADPPSDAPE